MLKQPIIESQLAMRLPSMAESLETQEQDPAVPSCENRRKLAHK
jgi:hypothetical protein